VTACPAPARQIARDRIAFVPQNPTTALNPASASARSSPSRSPRIIARKRPMPAPTHGGNLALVDCRRTPLSCGAIRTSFPADSSSASASPWRCLRSDLLVLDEPTTGLDVTTQEQILYLLNQVRARIGLAMLYVTHDLALLSQIADRSA